jgi:hypothetical protein
VTASAHLSDEDLVLYAAQMEQVKARIDAARDFLKPPFIYPRVEAGLLQVRQAMEALALSSLITNRKAVEGVATAFAKKNHDDALKLVRTVNPRFWPKPTSQGFDDQLGLRSMVPVTTGFLTEHEYMPTWGRLSAWLHASNPFELMTPPEVGATLGIEVGHKLITLLQHHSIGLLDRDELVVCVMNGSPTGRVHVTRFGSL